MDTRICLAIMLLGGFLLGLARAPYGSANIPLATLGMLLIVGPVFYLGESKKS